MVACGTSISPPTCSLSTFTVTFTVHFNVDHDFVGAVGARDLVMSQRSRRQRGRLRTDSEQGLPELRVQPELTYKILVVGGASVGKTALTRFYAEKDAAPYNQTVGSDLYVVPMGVLCGRQVYTKIIDVGHAEVAGTDSFLSITTANTSGVLLVFDVASPASLHALDAWVATLRAYIPGLGDHVPVFVLAHKADLYLTRASPPLIRPPDLNSYVAANGFTGWRFTSTKKVPGNDRLARSVQDAVHSLVESVLVRASKNHTALEQRFGAHAIKEPSLSSGSGSTDRGSPSSFSVGTPAVPEATGTLDQLLSHHNEATYVQIPQVARPGDAKLEIGNALIRPSDEMRCFHMGQELAYDKKTGNSSRDHAEGGWHQQKKANHGDGGGDGASNEKSSSGEFDVVDRALKEALERTNAAEAGTSFARQKRALLDVLQQRLAEQRSASVSATMSLQQRQEWQATLRLC